MALRRLARSTGSLTTKPEAVGVSVKVFPTGTCNPAGRRSAAEFPDLNTLPIGGRFNVTERLRADFGFVAEDFIVSTGYIRFWDAQVESAACHSAVTLICPIGWSSIGPLHRQVGPDTARRDT